MREALLLAARHLREARRGRGAVLALALGALALGAVAGLVPAGPGAASAALLGATLVVGAAAIGAAATSGTLLPRDRRGGRTAWLAAHRPSGVERRLGAVLAGVGVAFAAAAGAGLLGALALGAAGRVPGLRASRPLEVVGPTRLRGAARGGDVLRIVVPPAAGGAGRTLEVALRALHLRIDTTGQVPHVRHRFAGVEATSPLPYRAPLHLEVPAAGGEVLIGNPSDELDLVVESAHLLGGPRPAGATGLLLVLLLAGAAAALVPATVALSRVTSAPTAMGACLVFALLGALRSSLGAVPPGGGAGTRLAARLLGALRHLAPDLGGLGALSDPLAGRALAPGVLGGLVPLLPYVLGGLLLALVPWPGRDRGRALR